MILPSTHSAAILLLIVCFVCLGSWANLFKAAGERWRFELFSYDFALGAFALSLIAAWTFGTLGSDLSFSDRILVAGLRSQAVAGAGGFVFGVGALLFLGSIALSGMSVAFPIVFSLALLVWTGASGVAWSKIGVLAGGVVLLLAAVVFAARLRRTPPPAPVKGKQPPPAPISRNTKAIVCGVIAGLLIGGSQPLAQNAFWGDLGLGAYGGMLMYATGTLAAILIFGLFFMNIAIDGGGLTLRGYFKGKLRSHCLGWIAGAIWAAGMLAWLLAQSVPVTEAPSYTELLLFFEGAAVLGMLWGVLWREVRVGGLFLATVVSYGAGLVLLAMRHT